MALGENNTEKKQITKPSAYQTLLKRFSEERGIPISEIERVADRIAYHESAMTMDPKIKQQGGGPGRGLFQFEPDSLKTANQRAINFYKKYGEKSPFKVPEDYDASKLSAEDQIAFFILDSSMRKNFDWDQAVSSREGLVKTWGEGWQTKSDPKKENLFAEHMNMRDAETYEKQDINPMRSRDLLEIKPEMNMELAQLPSDNMELAQLSKYKHGTQGVDPELTYSQVGFEKRVPASNLRSKGRFSFKDRVNQITDWSETAVDNINYQLDYIQDSNYFKRKSKPRPISKYESGYSTKYSKGVQSIKKYQYGTQEVARTAGYDYLMQQKPVAGGPESMISNFMKTKSMLAPVTDLLPPGLKEIGGAVATVGSAFDSWNKNQNINANIQRTEAHNKSIQDIKEDQRQFQTLRAEDGLDMTKGKVIEIERGELLVDENRRPVDVEQFKIDKYKQGGTIKPNGSKQLMGKSKYNMWKAKGAKHNEMNPDGTTGIHIFAPEKYGVVPANMADSYMKSDEAGRNAIMSKIPKDTDYMNQPKKYSKGAKFIEAYRKYKDKAGEAIGSAGFTSNFFKDNPNFSTKDLSDFVATGGYDLGSSFGGSSNSDFDWYNLMGNDENKASMLQGYLRGGDPSTGGDRDWEKYGVDLNDPDYGASTWAGAGEDYQNWFKTQPEYLEGEAKNREKFNAAQVWDIRDRYMHKDKNSIDPIQRSATPAIMDVGGPGQIATDPGDMSTMNDSDPSQRYKFKQGGLDWNQFRQNAASMYNIGQGFKPYDTAERRFIESDKVQFTPLDAQQKSEALKSQALANKLIGQGHMSRGQELGALGQAQQRYMNQMGAINQQEARRFDDINRLNVGISNQDIARNLGLANQYDDINARNKAARSNMVAKGVGQQTELGTLARQEEFYRMRDHNKMSMELMSLNLERKKMGLPELSMDDMYDKYGMVRGRGKFVPTGRAAKSIEDNKYSFKDAKDDFISMTDKTAQTVDKALNSVDKRITQATDNLSKRIADRKAYNAEEAKYEQQWSDWWDSPVTTQEKYQQNLNETEKKYDKQWGDWWNTPVTEEEKYKYNWENWIT
jgi:hypothetical protein